MNGNVVLFADFTTLASDSNLVTVTHANVKDRIVIVDKDSILGKRIERKGCLVTLGECNNVIDTRVGSGVSASTLSYKCRRDQVGRDNFYGIRSSIDGRQLCNFDG